MTEDTLNIDTNFKTQSSQLGARFKSAREAMSLSQREAASRLNLNIKFIAMMESGNYEDSLPPTFIRGYLRSYARLLNVMEDELNVIIKQQEYNPAPAPVPPAPQVLLKAPKKTDRYIHWITYGVVLTLVVLVVTWWHSHAKYSVADVPSQSEGQATIAVPNANAPVTNNLTTPNPAVVIPATPSTPAANSVAPPSDAISSETKPTEGTAPAADQASETPAAPSSAQDPAQAAAPAQPTGAAANQAPTAIQPMPPTNDGQSVTSANQGLPFDAAQSTPQDGTAADADDQQPKHKHSKKHDLAKMLASPEPGLEVGD